MPLEAAEEEVLEDEGGLEEEGLSLDKVAVLSTFEDLIFLNKFKGETKINIYLQIPSFLLISAVLGPLVA